jgi:hypothetical protein
VQSRAFVMLGSESAFQYCTLRTYYLFGSNTFRRLLMALSFQAFMDESISGFADGEFVLAGHVAPAQQWAAFAREWEILLPSGTLAEDGGYHFKMSEMALTPERMERVQAFYRVIESHVTFSISFRMNLADFQNALTRIEQFALKFNFSIDLSDWTNPYYFAFRSLIDNFHSRRQIMESDIPLTEVVDFYFDDRTEKNIIYKVWDEYLAELEPEVQKFYGTTPRFENDRKFLPLQSADLWAWWVRRWYEEDAIDLPDKMHTLDFGTWRGKKRPVHILTANEDQIFEQFQQLLFANTHTITRDGKLIFPESA